MRFLRSTVLSRARLRRVHARDFYGVGTRDDVMASTEKRFDPKAAYPLRSRRHRRFAEPFVSCHSGSITNRSDRSPGSESVLVNVNANGSGW
jgi:hypothetical protein